jgi:hypothetical protein
MFWPLKKARARKLQGKKKHLSLQVRSHKICNGLVKPTPTLPEVIESNKLIHHLKRYKVEVKEKFPDHTYNKFTKSRVS